MNLNLRKVLSATGFVLATAAFAPATPASADELSLLEFQAGGIGAFQGGGSTFSGQLTWNPTYSMDAFWLRGDFGATLLNNASGSKFVAFNYEAHVGRYLVSTLGLEVGGGAVTWPNNGGTAIVLGGNAVYGLPTKLFGLINRVYAGYEHALFSGGGTELIRAGVGIAF